MEDIIRDIQAKIQQNRFPNEASISQGIVLRVIRALGWNVDDIDVVWPEFATGTQRADFALCHPAGKPLVLIEVKQAVTMSVQAEEQLAAYAYREGVPLVILTSGQDWHFYAPYGPGQFSDRRIYRLDLMERSPGEARERFERYLSFSSWVSGQANLSVQADLREMLSKQETRRKLPQAWAAILAEPNAQLVELLGEQLEKQTGSEPPKGEIVAFLRSLAAGSPSDSFVKPRVRTTAPSTKPAVDGPNEFAQKRRVYAPKPQLWIDGQEIPVTSSRDRMIKVVAFAASKDPSVLERVYQSSRSGRRTDIAPTPEALYPNNPEFAQETNHWREIPGSPGWFIDVNKGNVQMTAMIQRVCELAGIDFGKDVRVN